jgi:hypothetical protein
MDFTDRWVNVWKHSGLPNMAKDEIPRCLSERIEIAESKLSDEELGALFRGAVEMINQGSIASVEDLILRGLK